MIVTKIRTNIHAVSSAQTLNFIVAFNIEVWVYNTYTRTCKWHVYSVVDLHTHTIHSYSSCMPIHKEGTTFNTLKMVMASQWTCSCAFCRYMQCNKTHVLHNCFLEIKYLWNGVFQNNAWMDLNTIYVGHLWELNIKITKNEKKFVLYIVGVRYMMINNSEVIMMFVTNAASVWWIPSSIQLVVFENSPKSEINRHRC